jgi:major type 1 subunit fimbrin (pilin)
MNKTLYSAAMVATFGVAAIAPLSASASDGKITFEGEIIDATCTIHPGAGTTPGTGNDFTVTLDKVQKTAVPMGASAATKSFFVTLGAPGEAGCPNGKTAYLSFDSDPTTVDSATGALKNQTAGGSNVQVRLKNKSGGIINLATGAGNTGATSSSGVLIAGNTATLQYAAEYFAATAAGTPGLVSTWVTYSVAYN